MNPWLDAKTYYTRRWGEPLGRVGVDAGFSCPHRGPDRSQPGCAFCAEAGNRPPYVSGVGDLEEQIRLGLNFQSERYGFRRFSLYFQSYSSTLASVAHLDDLYRRGLRLGDFAELTVGTRPDCVPDEVADLLAAYRSPDREVWVELGLQSSRDDTLVRIRRGHNAASFLDSAARLRERNLPFTAHILYGLPGEGPEDFVNSVRFALAAGASGLKLHDLLLVPGTALHRDWQEGRIQPVDPQAYLEACAAALRLVPDSVVVWRVCSDVEDRTAAPPPGEKWPKNRFLNRLRTELLKQPPQ